ncbi:MAG TPA: lytic transglycosylase F, partial [Thermoanaerobaculia bacterium]
MRKRILLPALALALLAAAAGAAAVPQDKEQDRAKGTLPPTILEKRWTWDFDGMLKRRMMRVLVPYSKTLYFIDRGQQRGLAYDAFKMFEDEVNKRRKKGDLPFHVVFIPMARGEFIQALKDGRGDVAMAYLTITPERLKEIDFTIPTAANVSEIVVTGPGGPSVATAQDLSGQEVYLRQGSSYAQSVERLNEELKKAGRAPVRIRVAPDNLEAEDILEMVNAGLVPATIADDFRAKFWKQVFPKIELHPEAAVSGGGQMGWMIRKNSPLLKKELDAFITRYPEGSAVRNQLLAKYLRNTRYVKNATSREEREKFDGVVKLFRKYCDEYDMDTLLMAAQGYQES